MAFADNLRQIRKEKGLSQEALAELMGVSRQAVSKWEQGEGYPEVEKLLLLASKLNISLDSLMSTEISRGAAPEASRVTGTILISSPHENVVVSCYKVQSTQKMMGGKKAPQYALFGVSNGVVSFWGEPTTFLGWYADQESLAKEVSEIQQAMMSGIPTYELRHSVRVERKWLGRIVVSE